MATVLGIGGFFFRAKDPRTLARWYADHLDVTEVPQDYDSPAWRQSGGTTVFAPFQHDTDYFQDPEKQWMINFRVDDLDGMIARLEKAGIAVERYEDVLPNGRFARLADPEGNPIELWEPAGSARDIEERRG
ncbi:MAG: VOC family protein [Alphaproteobacteria bacterium]|nr:VOC family protein [Alphaproteobacteria bacterium]